MKVLWLKKNQKLRHVIIAEDILRVLWRKHIDGIVCARANIRFARARVPPQHTKQADESRHTDGVVHICWGDGPDGREEEDDADEDDPRDCDEIDGLAPSAHGVGSRVEDDAALVPPVRDDDGNVANVECGGRDVENRCDGLRAADAD